MQCLLCGRYYQGNDGINSKMQTSIVMGESDMYCSTACYNTAMDNRRREEDSRRAIEQAAQASAQAAAEAQRANAESELKAVKRAAWPEFEKKYASFFEDDIPDWFVNSYFQIDMERGRYVVVPEKSEELNGLIEIVKKEGKKADDFLKRYTWAWNGKGNYQWLNATELLESANIQKKYFEEKIGITLDPLTNDNWKIHKKYYSSEPRLYFKMHERYEKAYKFNICEVEAIDNSFWILATEQNLRKFFLPFKKEAEMLGKSIDEINFENYLFLNGSEPFIIQVESLIKIYKINISYLVGKPFDSIPDPKLEDIAQNGEYTFFILTDYFDRHKLTSLKKTNDSINSSHTELFSFQEFEKIQEKGPEKYFEELFGPLPEKTTAATRPPAETPKAAKSENITDKIQGKMEDMKSKLENKMGKLFSNNPFFKK